MKFKKLFSLVAGTVLIGFVANVAFLAQNPVHAEPQDGTLPAPPPVCVFGWSKDSCNGSLTGTVNAYTCTRVIDGTTVTCKTFHVSNATLEMPVKQSSGGCGIVAEQLCDRTPQLEGKLVIHGDFYFGVDNCPYRGAWQGRWRLYDSNSNPVASGQGNGTLGTGSHRSIGPCLLPFGYQCNVDCEKCYDVESQDIGGGLTVWRVALEGALIGKITAGTWIDSTLSITLSGTLNTDGNSSEPFDFGNWFYCGASDGVILAECQQ